MILLIGIFGPTPRKIKANYYLVFYTLAGSILFLFAILLIIVEQGTASLSELYFIGPVRNIRLQLFL
jgi:NADH:ubiquinone oxidoreductase subunit 4 (subunit M)